MSVTEPVNSLRHPPEVVVMYIRRVIDASRNHDRPERRSEQRDSLAIPITVQPLDEHFRPVEQAFSAVTKDISTGGIGLVLNEQVKTPYLQIEFESQVEDAIALLAQVRHCTRRGQYYHIGARFVIDWSLWR